MSREEQYDIPTEISNYLRELSEAIKSRDAQDINAMYEVRFQQLTNQFYGKGHGRNFVYRPWPPLRAVKRYLGNDPVMEQLYQFAHHRSTFMDKSVKSETAKASWDSYKRLFETLANDRLLVLPNGWLWDIFDEFVYQLQMVHLKHTRIGDTWGVKDAIGVLEKYIEATGVRNVISDVSAGKVIAENVIVDDNRMYNAGGVFAMIALLRIDVLLGDYRGALQKASDFVVGHLKQLTVKVPAAHVSLYYNVGFAYMMSRRYVDAATMYRMALNVKAVHRSYVDSVQVHVVMLMALTNTLGSQPMEDMSSFLNDTNKAILEEDIAMMAQGQVDRFREVFMRSCPKFIAIKNLSGEHSGHEARELQLRMFMREVNQQIEVLKLRGYFRVYSTMTTEKVNKLLDEAGELRIAPLLCAKHKSLQQVCGGETGSASSGSFESRTVVDFTVDGGSVSVVPRTQTEIPVSNTLVGRIENLNKRIAKLKQ